MAIFLPAMSTRPPRPPFSACDSSVPSSVRRVVASNTTAPPSRDRRGVTTSCPVKRYCVSLKASDEKKSLAKASLYSLYLRRVLPDMTRQTEACASSLWP
ncbi:hypothetical protein D9M69_661100 [compost metagenome]